MYKRQDLQRQLVEVAEVADTGLLHRVVDLVHGGVDGVDGDHTDHAGPQSLVAVSGDVATAVAQGDLHAQGGTHIQRCNVQLRIQHLHLAIGLDVAGRHLAGAGRLDKDGLGALAMQLGQQVLDVQNDLRHVLFHTGNGGKLMKNPVDLDGGNSDTGK